MLSNSIKLHAPPNSKGIRTTNWFWEFIWWNTGIMHHTWYSLFCLIITSEFNSFSCVIRDQKLLGVRSLVSDNCPANSHTTHSEQSYGTPICPLSAYRGLDQCRRWVIHLCVEKERVCMKHLALRYDLSHRSAQNLHVGASRRRMWMDWETPLSQHGWLRQHNNCLLLPHYVPVKNHLKILNSGCFRGFKLQDLISVGTIPGPSTEAHPNLKRKTPVTY